VLESRVLFGGDKQKQALEFGFFPKISTTVEKIVENAAPQLRLFVFGRVSLGFCISLLGF
jgi:hypothetical protein